jgi:UDP-N-acetylglucosamine--N-acetylmuramyl-(pentapeptide) pyrophosphoryl-undecaprenol N-acetylglucosamine transferase
VTGFVGPELPDVLALAALEPLLADPARRAAVAAGARAQGRPDAAERLADAVLGRRAHGRA